jgi:hypothetical protein
MLMEVIESNTSSRRITYGDIQRMYALCQLLYLYIFIIFIILKALKLDAKIQITEMLLDISYSQM